MVSFKRDVLSGIIALLPVVLVIYAVYWVLGNLALVPLDVAATGNPLLDTLLKGVIVLALILFVLLLVGRSTRTLVGKEVEDWFDRQINRIPAVRALYNASKVALEMALSEEREYEMPVRIHFTESMAVSGFKTGTTVVEGRETVFVPTSPNITSGLILYVEPEKVEKVDQPTEEVLAHVLSAGFLKPGEEETEEVESLLKGLGGSKED